MNGNTDRNRAVVRRGMKIIRVFLWLPFFLSFFFLFLPLLAGKNVYFVMSGSMEPAIHEGSLIYVGKAGRGELLKGDIITFYDSEKDPYTITHRIVGSDVKTDRFVTKGDHNQSVDPGYVMYRQIVGKVEGNIPYIGNLLSKMKGRSGFFCYFFIIILTIFIEHFLSITSMQNS